MLYCMHGCQNKFLIDKEWFVANLSANLFANLSKKSAPYTFISYMVSDIKNPHNFNSDFSATWLLASRPLSGFINAFL
jgi:hypothetical protein